MKCVVTSRERVLTALSHREPDRIPVTLAYEQPEVILQRYGKLPIDLPMRQDIYTVAPWHSAPPATVREQYYHDIDLPADTWIDGWGVARSLSSSGESLRTVGPLRKAENIADIEAFPWPDVGSVRCVTDLRAQVDDLHRQELAVVGVGGSIFEYSWYMFGMDRLMMALVSDPDVALRLFDKITERLIVSASHCASAGADILRLGDDIADQRGMMIAPELWRATLKPRLASIIASARSIQPDMPVLYHSDGNVSAVIDDLIEVGVTILNPVQPEALDPFEVKRRYGDRLSLWGAVGTQTVFPFYTPEEVRCTVRQYCSALGEGGGYVIGPTHSLERDVPWENIEAFYRAVEEFGVYSP